MSSESFHSQVISDLTILPGGELSIDEGVVMEFAPNIGILTFGRVLARGSKRAPIRLTAQTPKRGPFNADKAWTNSSLSSTDHSKTKVVYSSVVGANSIKPKSLSSRSMIGLADVRLIGGERVSLSHFLYIQKVYASYYEFLMYDGESENKKLWSTKF